MHIRNEFRKRVIARSIRALREAEGWSQWEIARAVHSSVTASTISRWERGHATPNSANCRRLYGLAKRLKQDEIGFVFGLSDEVWDLLHNEDDWRRLCEAREGWAKEPMTEDAA
jgi:transcriptional regulator with XRE-family HTH domain